MAPGLINTGSGRSEIDETETFSTPPWSPATPASPDDIAVVGMACHLPGNVRSPSEFWEFLEKEKSGYRPVPESAFNIDAYYHPDQKRPGSVFTKGGYFLDGDPRDFQPAFFGITAAEAKEMDPQQRQILEVAYECFESAGYTLDQISGSNTASYVANFTSDMAQVQSTNYEYANAWTALGTSLTIISNRVAFAFNLKGPSFTVDTACSSSMYALHLACNSLKLKECDGALVGGTNLIINIDQHLYTVKMGVLSATSTCHTFDEAADGYGRGEAVAAMYLKRLSDAVRDGDEIRAVIKGSAVNSNGKGPGIAHPSTNGQEAVIRAAYSRSGLDPTLTSYVECHGTGTPVGDPAEVHAIGNVFGKGRRNELLIGAVKSSIGHTEATSGLASVMKTVLALEKGRIPATIGLKNPNPNIDFKGSRCKVVTQMQPWPSELPIKRASVNSFGFGGANAHCILEAASPSLSRLNGYRPDDHRSPAEEDYPFLFVYSAHDTTALESRIKAIQEAAVQRKYSYLDLSYTLGVRRTRFFYGAYSIASSGADLATAKLEYGKKQPQPPVLAFAFTGQGAVWPEMGKELMATYASFRETITDLDEVLQNLPPSLRPEWKLQYAMLAPASKSQVYKAWQAQPLTTAVQIAVVNLLSEWKVCPNVVVGHSSGEIAAAYASGHVSQAEAIILAYVRGLVAEKAPSTGLMLAVGCGESEVRPFVEESNATCSGNVTIACLNSPKSVTLSGDEDAVEDVHRSLEAKGIFARLLRTDGRAYHSAHMEQVGDIYEELANQALASLGPRYKKMHYQKPFPDVVPMVSTVDVGIVNKGVITTAYWRKNLVSPVQFTYGLGFMLKFPIMNKKINRILEIGPHSALESPIKQMLEVTNSRAPKEQAISYASTIKRGQNSTQCMLGLAGDLFVSGYSVSLERVNSVESPSDWSTSNYSVTKGRFVNDLPPYKWTYTDKHWNESLYSREKRLRKHPRHDILGSRLPGTSTTESLWRNVLRAQDLPWLKDHMIETTVAFPATAYFAMAVEAVEQTAGAAKEGQACVLQNVSIKTAILIPETEVGTEVQFCLRSTRLTAVKEGTKSYEFSVCSYNGSEWVENCTGAISRDDHRVCPQPPSKGDCFPQGISNPSFYEKFARTGLVYGPTFQPLSDIEGYYGSRTAAADTLLYPTSEVMQHESAYWIHPATMDSCLQLSLYAAQRGVSDNGFLPVLTDKVTIWKRNRTSVGKALAWGAPRGLKAVYGGAHLVNGDGAPLMHFDNFRYVSFVPESLSMKRTEAVDRAPYFRLSWLPDMDLITNSQYQQLFPTSKVSAETLRDVARLLCLKRPTISVAMSADLDTETTELLLSGLGADSQYRLFGNLAVLSKRGEFIDELQAKITERYPAIAYKPWAASEDRYDLAVVKDFPLHGLSVEESLKEVRGLLRDDGKLLILTGRSKALSSRSYLYDHGFGEPSLVAASSDPSCTRSILLTKAIPLSNGSTNGVNGYEEVKPKCTLIHRHEPSALAKALAEQAADMGWDVGHTTIACLDLEEGSLPVLMADTESPLLVGLTDQEFAGLKTLCATSGQLLWVTNAAIKKGSNPRGAMTVGLNHCIANENPSFRLFTLDVENVQSELLRTSKVIFSLFSKVQSEGVSGLEDHDYVEEDGVLHVGRVVEDTTASEVFRRKTSDKAVAKITSMENDHPFKLHVGQAGLLDTLFFEDDLSHTEALGDDEVEIQVKAAGLNQKDVTTIMGHYDQPSSHLSNEYSGIVSRIGKRVTKVHVGDKCVVATGAFFNSFVRCHERRVTRVPDHITDSFEALATVPVVYYSAIYALHFVANLQPDETILIHTAAGGAGIALIRIAQQIGAKIFATVGTPEKRKLLVESFGIPEENIFNSRDKSFVQGLLDATNGEGVDVAINTVFNELLHATWDNCMAPFGRFIEMSKRDIIDRGKLSMSVFEKNVTFYAFDIGDVGADPRRMRKVSAMFDQLLQTGRLPSITPMKSFPVSEIKEAIRHFLSGSHIGKVVINYDIPDLKLLYQPAVATYNLKADACYLITGGLGGLGRNLIRWMISKGARNFVLISRSGVGKNKDAAILVDKMEASGIDVTVVQGDVTKREDVERAIAAATVPIKGVIHAAFVETDTPFEKLSVPDLLASARPKCEGAINLHESLLDRELDFFIMTSSLSSVTNAPYQSSYNSGNVALDALARCRRRLGLPAVALSLGLVADFGYVSEVGFKQGLSVQTFGSAIIDEDDYHQLMEQCMLECQHNNTLPSSVAGDSDCLSHLVTGLEVTKLAEVIRREDFNQAQGFFWEGNPRLSIIESAMKRELQSGSDANGSGSRSVASQLRELAMQDKNMACSEVSQLLREWLGQLLHLEPEQIDTSSSLTEYGMASMTSGELRIWFFKTLGVKVTLFETLNSENSIEQLGKLAVDRMMLSATDVS